MGIIQKIKVWLGLAVPYLAPGESTIAVTALFVSEDVMSRVLVDPKGWLVEHLVSAELKRDPTTRYPLGVKVNSAAGSLIGWVMPSDQELVNEIFATLEKRHERPISRIRMDCVLSGESQGRDFGINSVDLLYRESLEEL
jgi:hypothetical protein